jgi:hypothetical protein
MLNIKNLIATIVFSSLAAVTFAQAPGTTKKGVSHTSVAAHKHKSHVAKPKQSTAKSRVKKHHKVRHHAKNPHKATLTHKS